MINKTEAEERAYLAAVKGKLQTAADQIDADLERYSREIREQKTYLWEQKSGMDRVEQVQVRQGITQDVMLGEKSLAKKERIGKLLRTPYFGRIDFTGRGSKVPEPLYIGIHTFSDPESEKILIYDWRAPVSTMFYDFELGKAFYISPEGKVSGEIALKRQYRIRGGKMEFMLESGLNIQDDVLQKELSGASDDRMKNIVATIQRDQNAIIRNEKSHALIIQGVAGSGKTSIALHRVAFLLYRFKETIASRDILIISPNKVFADYISNVLPELGEEKIVETGIEKLADELLGYEHEFQTFFEQVALLLEDADPAFQKRIRAKAGRDFLAKLDDYVRHLETAGFSPSDFFFKKRRVPASFIKERFRACIHLPLFQRFERVAQEIEHYAAVHYDYDVKSKERTAVKNAVKKMFKSVNVFLLYKDFYARLGAPELFKPAKASVLEYSDVFPLIYLKLRLEGGKAYDKVKHLLIDEMQDYTAVQYAVISKVFPCRKTVLGDANQSVNPFSSSNVSVIQSVLTDADCVKLCKSYRSTYEITRFAQRISPNPDLVAIERRGEEPSVKGFKTEKEEIAEVRRLIARFKKSGLHSLGIICKTQKQAGQLFGKINTKEGGANLLTEASAVFTRGVTVCAAYLAKGLEFDEVIVPGADAENYRTVMDKSMLYVACTRAMHRLTATFTGSASPFLSGGAPAPDSKTRERSKRSKTL